jgi:hypothetical protein
VPGIYAFWQIYGALGRLLLYPKYIFARIGGYALNRPYIVDMIQVVARTKKIDDIKIIFE